MRTAIKYTVYCLISLFLFALPFMLLPLPIFKADDLNPLFLLFFINPFVILLQGILSALVLKGKMKWGYMIAAPFVGFFLITAFYFACDTNMPISFSRIFTVVGQLFRYPMTIISIIYIIAPWLGVIAVKIFKKLSVVLSPLFKYEN